jgi:hypothetical protein
MQSRTKFRVGLIVTFVTFVTFVTSLAMTATPLHAQRSRATRPAAGSTTSTSSPANTPATPAAAAAAPVTAPAPADGDSYNVLVPSVLRAAPSAGAIGDLRKGASVTVLARDRGWVRVRAEGWVPDSALTPADTTFRAGLSAADLRADPVAAHGKMVVWTVEFLALQTADPLRHGLADGEPYILARGPGSENALLYLVVPPSLVGTARALQPLAKITITARVRDGRSEPVGVPILDLQTIRRTR